MIAHEAIARLRALESLATPGSWEVQERVARYAIGPVGGADIAAAIPKADTEAADDAEFIAAMRNALPELLDEIERLRGSAGMSGKE